MLNSMKTGAKVITIEMVFLTMKLFDRHY